MLSPTPKAKTRKVFTTAHFWSFLCTTLIQHDDITLSLGLKIKLEILIYVRIQNSPLKHIYKKNGLCVP